MPDRWNDDVFIGLGSNKGDRRKYIDRAILLLDGHPGIERVDCSSMIETEPVGEELERRFLNGVVKCRSRCTPSDLLEALEQTERDLGRRNKGDNKPRTIDLDLLFFGQRMIDSPDLTVPHPRAHRRTFVLEPMVELAPHFVHPALDATMKELLSSLSR